MTQCKIKSSDGRWAKLASRSGSGMASGRPWISVEALEMWERALSRAREQGRAEPKELARALALARGLDVVRGATCWLPRTPQQEAKVAQEMADLKSRMAKNDFDSDREGYPMSHMVTRQVSWDRRVALPWSEVEAREDVLKHFQELHSTKSSKGFAGMPEARWTDRPSEAALLEAGEARQAIQRAKDAVELSGLLAQARKQAKALGESEAGWRGLVVATLGEPIKLLASGEPEGFEAAAGMEEREAYVLYATGSHGEGFVDKTGRARNDLSEASMFPNKKTALAFAQGRLARHHGGFYAVKVATTVLGFEPLWKSPAPSKTLREALALRESSELAQALRMAQVEQLEEELAARKAQSSKSSGKGRL